MNAETPPSPVRGAAVDSCKSTARLIATFGGARILRHRDGSLDVSGRTPGERQAALAWICAVSPELARRVRRAETPGVGAHN